MATRLTRIVGLLLLFLSFDCFAHAQTIARTESVDTFTPHHQWINEFYRQAQHQDQRQELSIFRTNSRRYLEPVVFADTSFQNIKLTGNIKFTLDAAFTIGTAGTTSGQRPQFVFVSDAINVGGTVAGQIKLQDTTNTAANFVAFKAPTTLSAPYTMVMPTAIGAGLIQTDGSGNISFSNSLVGTSPLTPSTAGGSALGTATFPWSTISFSGLSASPGTNNFKLTGTSTGGLRTITFPDASITVARTDAAQTFTGNQTFSNNVLMTSTVSNYNNVNTAGNGIVAIYGRGRSTAQVAAVASVATFTPTADGSFEVSADVLVTTATSHSFTVTCAYTDEGNTSRTLTLPFVLVAGSAIVNTVVNTNGTVPYMGIPVHIRAKANTAITIATTGTFTTVTYNVEGIIKQTSN